MLKKPYPPGQKKRKRTRSFSEYGKELREKQKLKNWYNLREKQFRNYVKEVLTKRGKEDAVNLLIRKLETRFDNVIFRLGFASSRVQARQLVNHGHFLVNGKAINIPSYQIKKGDKISLHPSLLKKPFSQNLKNSLKEYQPPSWIFLDKEKLKGRVESLPSFEEAAPPAEIPVIFEYYSR
jgi:small subunit ribosomal protein S4